MSQTEKPSGTPGNRRFGVRRKPRGLGKVPGSIRTGNVQLGHQLLDVSRSGARLLVRSELEKGALVHVALPWPSKAQQEAMGATVAWCIATANGGFCVGVQFHRLLTEEELTQVLGPAESALLPPARPSALQHRNQPAPPLR